MWYSLIEYIVVNPTAIRSRPWRPRSGSGLKALHLYFGSATLIHTYIYMSALPCWIPSIDFNTITPIYYTYKKLQDTKVIIRSRKWSTYITMGTRQTIKDNNTMIDKTFPQLRKGMPTWVWKYSTDYRVSKVDVYMTPRINHWFQKCVFLLFYVLMKHIILYAWI